VSEQNNETRLAARYEAIRRREYELITDLLNLLPKIETLGEERVSQVRDALFHADHPFLIVFVGPFSSGKSSIINALLGDPDLLPVGPVPTTDRISILRYGEEAQRMASAGEVNTVFHPSPLLEKVSFVDTPGLESVFQRHEETTRRFLHRSDIVILVMLATQAMTQRNVEYLQQLREYGKKIIIMINQADLLSDEDAETVRDYVLDQGKDKLGEQPEVWLVSAKQGLAARRPRVSAEGETLSGDENGAVDPIHDEALWQNSGLWHMERYIDKQLSDVDRLRQKLQTPLQIIQSVHRVALDAVRANQAVLDQYQSIADNVQGQLDAYRREQQKIVREANEDISKKFSETAMRGSEAIRDTFQLSRAVGSVGRGLADLSGIARLFRRGGQSYTRLAFERHKVFEPIAELPPVVDRLGPRLEGKDLKDADDLVKYAQREIKTLPEDIRSKVIGSVNAPTQYDRAELQDVRATLEEIEEEAREDETAKLDGHLRNVLFGLAIWELLVIFSLAAILLSGALDFSEPISFGIVILMLVLGMAGLLILPVAGRFLETNYTNRILKLQSRYIDELTRAADKQIEYGMRLRREVVAPLTRLVETQTHIQTEQLNQLQHINQEMVEIESELTKLSRRNVFGMRG
jgi:GTP-binding protein EngB required for normal cell division